ncbi:MAG: HAD family hydrolase [Candidatus Krumholzibacteriota bacterium]
MAVWKRCLPGESSGLRPVLFLDRDGVVIRDRDYLSDPDQVELIPGVAETMKAATSAGYLLVGISNQSGLGRNLFTMRELTAVMERLEEILAASGTGFDGFYYCPHAPEDQCTCRKPGTGLLDEVAETCRWDVGRSWVVGDKASDVALARAGGMGGVLVRTGNGRANENEVGRMAVDDSRILIAADLPAAFAALRLAESQDPDR